MIMTTWRTCYILMSLTTNLWLVEIVIISILWFFSLANVQALALKYKEQEHAGLLKSASEMKVLYIVAYIAVYTKYYICYVHVVYNNHSVDLLYFLFRTIANYIGLSHGLYWFFLYNSSCMLRICSSFASEISVHCGLQSLHLLPEYCCVKWLFTPQISNLFFRMLWKRRWKSIANRNRNKSRNYVMKFRKMNL